MPIKTIASADFMQLIESGKATQVLDVRTLTQHAENHLLAPHRHIPVDELEASNHEFDEGQPLYILCGGGTRATRAAGILEAKGYENAVVVTGGLRGLKALGAATSQSADVVACKPRS